jgi:hypothetical protein
MPLGIVDLVGWSVGGATAIGGRVAGQIEYTHVSSHWQYTGKLRDVRRLAPSVIRPELEQVHDLSARLDADVRPTSTKVSVLYRASTGFSGAGAGPMRFGSRFDIQVRQPLRFRPTRGSRVELLFSIRNLFRDARGESSWYDELLTVAPPTKFMGGIQVKF